MSVRAFDTMIRRCEQKPPIADSIFLATHEPCCLCMTAIVSAGFQQCYFLYPYAPRWESDIASPKMVRV